MKLAEPNRIGHRLMIRKQQRSFGGGRFLRKETLMKKIISILLILVMVLAAVGCSSDVTEPTEYSATDVAYSSDSPAAGPIASHPGKTVTESAGEDSGSAGSSATGSVSGAGSEIVIERPEFRIETKPEAPVINHDDSTPAAAEEGEPSYALFDMKESKTSARDGAAGIAGGDYGDYGGADGFDYSFDEGGYFEYDIEAPAAGEIWITDPVDPIVIDDPYEPYEPVPSQISAGLLTAGEWNDNRNFWFIQNLLSNGQSYNYSDFFKKWGLSPFTRLVVKCLANGSAVEGARVSVTCASSGAIYEGVTDHDGLCYVYYSVIDQNASPTEVSVIYGGETQTAAVTPAQLTGEQNVEISFENRVEKTKKLDLMFTIDTTGSMSDEIRYLQKELENVIIRVKNDCGNIPVRLSVNFYRDHGDAYVVKPYEFTTDIDSALASLAREYADGGGDYEEAVELALESSINDHDWDEDSIKLMFMVLDAPPHNTASIRESLHESIMAASKKGIRIIPVASSGVDKDTEFLLRAFAMTTGGTYTFLTDDSGIGGSHLEPTVGDYEVEHLNDMLVRIIEEYIG